VPWLPAYTYGLVLPRPRFSHPASDTAGYQGAGHCSQSATLRCHSREFCQRSLLDLSDLLLTDLQSVCNVLEGMVVALVESESQSQNQLFFSSQVLQLHGEIADFAGCVHERNSLFRCRTRHKEYITPFVFGMLALHVSQQHADTFLICNSGAGVFFQRAPWIMGTILPDPVFC